MPDQVERPHAMLVFPRDFVSDNNVEEMTTQEVGAYWLILCKAWFETPPGTIPDDDTTLAKWSRLSFSAWRKARTAVLKAFHKGEDNRWHQKRMIKEHHNASMAMKKRRERSQRASQARWSNRDEKNADKNGETGMLEECLRNAQGDPQAMLNDAQPHHTTPHQKRKSKKEKTAPPPLRGLKGVSDPNSPRIAWSVGQIPTDVLEGIHQLPDFQNASTLKYALGRFMRSIGFKVHFEVPVADRGDGTPGRIDLVGLRGEEVVAIEADRITAREKSIAKLTAFRQPGVVVLRAPRGPRPAGLVLPEGYEVSK